MSDSHDPAEPAAGATPDARNDAGAQAHAGGGKGRPRKNVALAVAAGVLLPVVAMTVVLSKPKPAPEVAHVEAAVASAQSGGDVGVSECDEYMKQAEECQRYMPQAMRDTMKASFAKMREDWRIAAASPDKTDSLRSGCKSATERLAKNKYCRMATSPNPPAVTTLPPGATPAPAPPPPAASAP